MYKIVIIGGGIAGLSTAFILADIPNLDISIYEKEDRIGGQASSMYNDNCYTEYSWRIFGRCYHNLFYVINKLGIIDNFRELKNNCLVQENGKKHTLIDLTGPDLFMHVLQNESITDVGKYLKCLTICKDRAINDYRNIDLYNYTNHNPIVKTVAGPFLGMDASKVSVSGVLKNIYSTIDGKTYDFSPPATMVTKNPTQNALFDPWEAYLKSKGVKIYKNHQLEEINTKGDKIESIKINNQIINGNEFVFACSLTNLNNVIVKSTLFHKSNPTFEGMKKLEKDLQLYFTINLYFSEKIENNCCSQMVMVDMPWQPIIQIKQWDEKYLNECHKIKEVWNVGFLDHYEGLLIKKKTSECTIEEAVKEGIYQIKNSKYIKSLFKKESFDDLFMGSDYWYQFKEKNNKLIVDNPKFSINTETMNYMPNSKDKDLPSNMLLAGYYVNSTMGGVSMEASCETGLTTGQIIINKYKLNSSHPSVPIQHNNDIMTNFTFPLVYTDKVLYELGLPAMGDYVDSTIILLIYILILMIIIYLILKSLYSQTF